MTMKTLMTKFSVLMILVLLVGCAQNGLTNAPIQSDPNQNTKQTAVSTDTKETNHPIATQTPNKVQGELKVHYIDVGQGASQLIIGPTGKTILIDAGNNDKASVVVDYLKKQKVSKIDILIGTHPDADHVGGLDKVIDSFDVSKIYMPKVQSNTKTFEDVLLAIQRKGLKVSTAQAGLTLDWESDAGLKIIAPIGQHTETNDMSAVIHLTFGSTSFMFTGDAETKSEQEMIESKVDLQSDVLLVGHHGSRSSTSQAFLDAVKPSYAVIQVGRGNNYGHPTSEVLKRLSDQGIKIYRNDEQGNIVFTTDGKKITVAVNKGDLVSGVSPSTTKSNQPAEVKPTETSKQNEANVVYNNCSDVRTAGKAPIKRGQPGYSSKLDRDGDGIACE